MTRETGIDPNSIRPESPLLSDGVSWGLRATMQAAVWVLIVIGIILGLHWALH